MKYVKTNFMRAGVITSGQDVDIFIIPGIHGFASRDPNDVRRSMSRLVMAFLCCYLSLVPTGARASWCNLDEYEVFFRQMEGAPQHKALCIKYEQLQRAPEWMPGLGEPPLSVSRAVEIALKLSRTKIFATAIANGAFDSIRVNTIEIVPTDCRDTTRHCYVFVVEIRPYLAGEYLRGDEQQVAVLMDGTTVQAVIAVTGQGIDEQ